MTAQVLFLIFFPKETRTLLPLRGNSNTMRAFALQYSTFYIYFSTKILLNKQGLC